MKNKNIIILGGISLILVIAIVLSFVIKVSPNYTVADYIKALSDWRDVKCGDGVKIDGNFNEGIYNNMKLYSFTAGKNDAYKLELGVHLGELGAFFKIVTTDKGVFYNESLPLHNNSSVILYLQAYEQGKPVLKGINTLQARVAANGETEQWMGRDTSNYPFSRTFFELGSATKIFKNNELLDFKPRTEVNFEDATGYCAEMFIPYKAFGLSAKPDKLLVLPELNKRFSISETETRTMYQAPSGRNYVDPTTYIAFDNSGFSEFKNSNNIVTASGGFAVPTDDTSSIVQYGGYYQELTFNNVNSNFYYIEADVSINKILNKDKYPKFGLISAKNKNNTLCFFVDPYENLENKEIKDVDKTSDNLDWRWEATLGKVPNMKYKNGNFVKLAVLRDGKDFYYFVNGEFISKKSNYRGLSLNDNAMVGFATINAEVTYKNYIASTDPVVIRAKKPKTIKEIDANLDDWSATERLNRVDINGKEAFKAEGFTAYSNYVKGEGLYIAGVAKHKHNPTTSKNWWERTNFEFFLNGDNQGYVTPISSQLTSQSVLKTTGVEGDYTTAFELYIADALIPNNTGKDFVKVGVAFKVPGENILINYRDEGKPTDWWWAPRHFPSSANEQYFVYSDGFFEFSNRNDEVNATDGFKITSDKTAPIHQTGGGYQELFFNNIKSSRYYFESDLTVNGVLNNDKFPKFGLIAANSNDNIVSYLIDTNSNLSGKWLLEVDRSAPNGDWAWKPGFAEIKNLNYTNGNYIKLGVLRDGNDFYYFVNGEFVYKFSNYKAISAGDETRLGLLTMNADVTFANYSVTTNDLIINDKTPKISKIIDGNLSDWTDAEKLNNISVYGINTYAEQGFTTYARYKKGDGLYLAGFAKHKSNSFGKDEWYKNTNFEFFINGDNQKWVINNLSGNVTQSSFITTGKNGDYTTTFEIFVSQGLIPNKTENDFVKVGFAFKSPNELIKIKSRDEGNTTDWWWAAGHLPNDINSQYCVFGDGIFKYANRNNISNATDGFMLTSDTTAPIRQTGGGYQELLFSNIDATKYYFETEVAVHSILNGDLYPKYGLIAAINDKNSLSYFIDPFADLSNKWILAVDKDANTDAYLWGPGMAYVPEIGIKNEKYVKLAILRNGADFYFFINGHCYAKRSNYRAFTATDSAKIGFATANADVTYQNYSIITDNTVIDTKLADIKLIDGVLSDWALAEKTNNINVFGNSTFKEQGFNVYAKYITGRGLYLSGIGKHKTNPTTSANWWERTNFEFFINGNNQCFVTASASGGALSQASLITTGSNGDYTTSFEVFIADGIIPNLASSGFVKAGFAFKVAGEFITIENRDGGNATDWWWEAGHLPNDANLQYSIFNDGIFKYANKNSLANATDGFKLTTDTTAPIRQIGGGVQELIFNEINNTKYYFETDVALNKVLNGEPYPKIGLIAANNEKMRLSFFADPYDNSLIKMSNTNFSYWENLANVPVMKDSFKTGGYVKLAVLRYGADFYFIVNGHCYAKRSNLPGLSAGETSKIGFITFQADTTYQNYSFTTDETVVNSKLANVS